MRHLGRRPERELALSVDLGDAGMLLDRQVRVALVKEEVLEDVIGGVDRLRDLIRPAGELERLQAMDIPELAVRMNPGLGILKSLFRRRNRAKNAVFDLDQVKGFGRGLLILRHYRRD